MRKNRSMSQEKIKVLFVCLGNICRSPMGEGLFKHHVRMEGLEDEFLIDSAGTAAYHVGNLSDNRMRELASTRGIELNSRARQIEKGDIDTFDYILAMDTQNYEDIDDLQSGMKPNVYLMRDFDSEKDSNDVPDPYYGGIEGFEEVYQIVNRSAKTVFEHIKKADL